MKDIILLAMSTLPREAISADDFSTPKADVKDCRSQLESVVRYFVNASQTEDVLILGRCTAPTLEAEGAPAAAAPEEVKYFINFSNHPSKNEKGEPVWNERQIKAAEKYGPILDIPFPPVPGAASDGTIKKMARESVALILGKNPAAVMCQGEFTLSYAVIKGLLEEGVTVLAACAERNTYEQDGKQITEFEFVKFRKYR